MVISSLLCVTCPVLTHGMLHAYMHLYTDGSVVRLGRGHLESAKHLKVQGPPLHVLLATMCTSTYDPVQVLLLCIGHLGAKHLEGVLSTLECRHLMSSV